MIDDASPTNRPAVCHPLAPRARMDANSTPLSRVAAYRMSPSPAVRTTTMNAISSSMNPKKARNSGTERSCSTSSAATRIPLAPRLRIPSSAVRQSAPARRSTRYRCGSMFWDLSGTREHLLHRSAVEVLEVPGFWLRYGQRCSGVQGEKIRGAELRGNDHPLNDREAVDFWEGPDTRCEPRIGRRGVNGNVRADPGPELAFLVRKLRGEGDEGEHAERESRGDDDRHV